MRLILAKEERERSYGIKEKSIRQLYIKSLNLLKESPDALRINQCSEDELANVIEKVMKTRTSEGKLSIQEVEDSLTLMSEQQKQSVHEAELRKLIQKSSAVDQKWLVRMILKRTQMPLSTAKILNLLHPQGNKLFLKYNHLSKVVELIESDQVEAAMVEVTQLFEPIRSMLCQKFTSNLNKDFLQNEIYHETKMDGERFQIHMQNSEYRYYSRNGHEFSDGFNQLLTPLINFDHVVHSIILDGEMLVYDKEERRYHTKGETAVDVKHMKDKSSNLRPCFCAFDILLFNGENYMNRPYSERHQLLHELYKDREGAFVKTAPVRIRNIDHLVDLFNTAISNEEEGIVLKDAKSVYKPGDRSGGWYKVKADYFDGEVVKEFDCVIIGGSYANPYTKNYIRRYTLGCVEETEDGLFNVYAIGEVVHGVTRQERLNIFESLQPFLVEHFGEKEVTFEKGKVFFGRSKPDVWIPPHKSIVLECKASELVKSSDHYSEYTLRFPRINNVRRDKIWEESCTYKEFLDMCQSEDGRVKKTVVRQVNKNDVISPSRKRKAINSAANNIHNFCQRSEELEDFILVDNVLEGKEFCVLTTNPKFPSLREMKLMVQKHGGTITAFPRKGKTFAIVAGIMTKNVQNYMKEKIYNVIKADWLVNNFGSDEQSYKEMPKLRPVIDLFFATNELKESTKEFFDEYGDSYTEKFLRTDDLKAFLKTMPQSNAQKNFSELDDELVSHGLTNMNIFRNVSAAFFTNKSDNFSFESAKSIMKIRGGKTLKLEETKNQSVIIVDKYDNHSKISKIIGNTSGCLPQVVDFHWILDSSDAGELLDVEIYSLQVCDFH